MPNPDLFNARQAYFDDVIPTLDGASHVAGDVLGGLLTFNFRMTTPSIILVSAQLVDDDKSGHTYTLHLFRSKPATIADNAPFTLTAADASKRFAKLVFDTWDDLGGANAQLLDIANVARLAPIGNVYGYLIANTTYTPTAGALIVGIDAADMF